MTLSKNLIVDFFSLFLKLEFGELSFLNSLIFSLVYFIFIIKKMKKTDNSSSFFDE